MQYFGDYTNCQQQKRCGNMLQYFMDSILSMIHKKQNHVDIQCGLYNLVELSKLAWQYIAINYRLL